MEFGIITYLPLYYNDLYRKYRSYNDNILYTRNSALCMWQTHVWYTHTIALIYAYNNIIMLWWSAMLIWKQLYFGEAITWRIIIIHIYSCVPIPGPPSLLLCFTNFVETTRAQIKFNYKNNKCIMTISE